MTATVSTFFDAVFVNATETSGYGPFTLGTALPGFQTAASAGITNSTPVSYRATDGTNWETAHGVVDVSGAVYTLTRGADTIKSSNSNSLVNFGSGVSVVITPLSQDLNAVVSTFAAQSFNSTQQAQARTNIGAASVSAVRPALSANQSYYVNGSTGSDSNDGLTSGTAFLTLAHAWAVLAKWDMNNYNITVNVAAGTYTAGIQTSVGPIGSGTTYLVGAGSGTTSITDVLNLQINCACWVSVQGFTFSSASGHCLLASAPGSLIFIGSDVKFGATAGYHLYTSAQGRIACVTNYTITGGAYAHMYSETGSNITVTNNTVTIGASVTFGLSFAWANNLGSISGGATTYSLGIYTVTGARYTATGNGVISVGGGSTYYPGNSSGTTSTGGQYV